MIQKRDEYKLGSIVRLKEPYEPDSDNQIYSHVSYKSWKGFTHGIVVEILSTDHFSLYLYDPINGYMYIDGDPVLVDFHANELF